MSTQGATDYQKAAVNNVLEIFRHAEKQLRLVPDTQARMAITAHNGAALLEAPTGSGKTLMAGRIAEGLSEDHPQINPQIVWFWFTPFTGLVEQARSAIKDNHPSLRVRDLVNERTPATARSGDLFVATWASVASSEKKLKIVRRNGDAVVALDDYVKAIREDGFRIGVVVDEAHHGFTKAGEAVSFYRNVLQPDFTLLVTATPDDSDVERFKQSAGIAELHRIRVSRQDAVDAGLIKDGIKSIAYMAPQDQSTLLDFAQTAINDGWQMHCAIRNTLQQQGISLTPLMLVQVGNSDAAVDEAKTKLLLAGVPESMIAWYTSSDPNDDLLVVAKDETKQVLIFKVAVALGFDAPRAFTLVSMRGAKDTDFGIQVVGRILRVHPRLRSAVMSGTLSEFLRYGYVFLADAQNQTGLTSAGEKINTIKTELSKVSPFTLVVSVAGTNEVQVTQDGQTSLISLPFPPQGIDATTTQAQSTSNPGASTISGVSGVLTGLVLTTYSPPVQGTSTGSQSSSPASLPGNRLALIRDGVPRVFKTEILPLDMQGLLACIGAKIDINDGVITSSDRRNVEIKKTTVEIFAAEDSKSVTKVRAVLSDSEIARRAQRVLLDAEYLDPRDLHGTLMQALQAGLDMRGMEYTPESLDRRLNMVLAMYPNIVRKTAKQCCADAKELQDTEQLPESLVVPSGAKKSDLNIYGVMPLNMNSIERDFALLLDEDASGIIEYWFRNDERKPWSIAVIRPNGERYFPDFAVKVKGRVKGGGFVLVETKGDHILNSEDSLDKAMSEHKVYGVPLMLVQEENKTFTTVRYDEKTDKNQRDQVFRLDLLK